VSCVGTKNTERWVGTKNTESWVGTNNIVICISYNARLFFFEICKKNFLMGREHGTLPIHYPLWSTVRLSIL
jgi:hypothetical protein